MKKIVFSTLLTLGLWTALPACQSDKDEETSPVPEGYVQVQPEMPQIISVHPSSDRRSRANNTLLIQYTPHALPEGTTLWLLIKGNENGGTPYKSLKSYVVKGKENHQSLYPCEVNAAGEVIHEEVAPLYLPYGKYTFTGVSPARAFLDANGTPIQDPVNNTPSEFRQRVKNGQYLISNDERYEQTTPVEQSFQPNSEKVQILKMRPMINQTAQLKFTIAFDPNDPYLHSCDISPIGVEISGIQTQEQLWKPALKDTLKALPGKKTDCLFIYDSDPGVKKYATDTDKRLEITASVLPTDCTSNSVIVLFNLEVNGMPTQYEMMLNRKILRAGFSYHYVGKLSLIDGITAIAWQYVEWDTDVELDI